MLISQREGVFDRFWTDVLERKYKQRRTSYGVPKRNHIYCSCLKSVVALALKHASGLASKVGASATFLRRAMTIHIHIHVLYLVQSPFYVSAFSNADSIPDMTIIIIIAAKYHAGHKTRLT